MHKFAEIKQPGLHWWLIMRTLRASSGSMFNKISCISTTKCFGNRNEMHFHSTTFFNLAYRHQWHFNENLKSKSFLSLKRWLERNLRWVVIGSKLFQEAFQSLRKAWTSNLEASPSAFQTFHIPGKFYQKLPVAFQRQERGWKPFPYQDFGRKTTSCGKRYLNIYQTRLLILNKKNKVRVSLVSLNQNDVKLP